MRSLLFTLLALAALAGAGFIACGDSSITACGDEPDVTGAWQLALGPAATDLGADATLAGSVEVEAELEQAGATDFLGIGHYVYGTLSASDGRYFGKLTIPRLLKNDGRKTGAVLGCELRINVPMAASVSDDDVDQGPLRIALVGRILRKGELVGLPGSTLIMADDQSFTPREFSWTGARRTP
jgi:hypothetical protein